VWYFENACRPQVFISSADWMPRNFFRRIEVAVPIEDGVLADRLVGEVLATTLDDNTKTRLLQPDGIYRRVRPARGQPSRRSQFEFIALANNGTGKETGSARRKTKYPQVRLAARPPGLDKVSTVQKR
jgi:polyphosphate kinase